MHQTATALLHHLHSKYLGAYEVACKVYGKDSSPISNRQLGKWTIPQQRRIVNQDITIPKLCGDVLSYSCYAFWVSNICAIRSGQSLFILYQACSFFGSRQINVDHGNLAALLCKRLSDGATNPAATARNNTNFTS